jgi:hypothetical protein
LNNRDRCIGSFAWCWCFRISLMYHHICKSHSFTCRPHAFHLLPRQGLLLEVILLFLHSLTYFNSWRNTKREIKFYLHVRFESQNLGRARHRWRDNIKIVIKFRRVCELDIVLQKDIVMPFIILPTFRGHFCPNFQGRIWQNVTPKRLRIHTR